MNTALANVGSIELIFLAAVCLLAVWAAFGRKRRMEDQREDKEPLDLSASLSSTFLIKPYLQLGDSAKPGITDSVELWWHVTTDRRSWSVRVRVQDEKKWRRVVAADEMKVDIAAMGPHKQCHARLLDLPLGVEFDYRVLVEGATAFSGKGKTRNAFDQSYTFAVAGDLGESEKGDEQKVAYRLAESQPDFVVMPGDIVYNRGRVSEYLRNLFPVYNADKNDQLKGAPVMRSRIVMPCAGNHDLGMPDVKTPRDFSKHHDLMGYFLFWSVPLNGPYKEAKGPNIPLLTGDEKERYRFAVAAGERYPRIANYSFDWGNAHWTVLDSNAYVDWTDAELRAWVAADLAKNQQATWRFVVFHHPAFSSDNKHINEQRTRLMANLFERCNVDVVFSGHMHCYERSRPLRFKENALVTKLDTEDCPVEGTLQIDNTFDGKTVTRPKGVIYIGTGAAGAKFYPESIPAQLKPYSAIYDQSAHSFTHVRIEGSKLTMRQINAHGVEIDSIVIEK